MFDIRLDDLSGEKVRALLALHLAGMRSSSPPGHSFALDLSGLQGADITVWTVWREDEVVGVGALKDLGGDVGELKSMRTHPDHLREGVATCLLDHIITEAKVRGMKRLSLETGSGPLFEAGIGLYRKRGFIQGGAFSSYVPSAFNQFFHLTL